MLSNEERERYARHIILGNMGEAGQEKLKNARVLVIGAGGLGSPAIMYLAASGIGNLGIADFDNVELSNLQRQIIHRTDRIGVKKAVSAAQTASGINPNVNIKLCEERVCADNIEALIKEYDFIIDAVDNFAAKFLINDACVLNKKPFCHGGINGFNGQLMTYVPGNCVCLRCIFENIPPKPSAPLGVFGTIPGIIGAMQAMEAQKYIMGVGELLTGRMLTLNGLTMSFKTTVFAHKNPDCPSCGSPENIHLADKEI